MQILLITSTVIFQIGPSFAPTGNRVPRVTHLPLHARPPANRDVQFIRICYCKHARRITSLQRQRIARPLNLPLRAEDPLRAAGALASIHHGRSALDKSAAPIISKTHTFDKRARARKVAAKPCLISGIAAGELRERR